MLSSHRCDGLKLLNGVCTGGWARLALGLESASGSALGLALRLGFRLGLGLRSGLGFGFGLGLGSGLKKLQLFDQD